MINEKEISIKLEQIKKNNIVYYQKILNLFSFLYKDIKQGYFGREIDQFFSIVMTEKANNTASGNPQRQLNNLQQMSDALFDVYVEQNNNGLINNLMDIALNSDKRFVEKFFEAVELPIDILKSGVNIESKSYLYIINLYLMLYAFKKNLDDYENFSRIVDDVRIEYIESYDQIAKKDIKSIMEKINILNSLVSNPQYKEYEFLPKILKDILKNIDNESIDKKINKYDKIVSFFRDFNRGIQDYKIRGETLDNNVLNEIIIDFLEFVDEEKTKTNILYCSHLLRGNRYHYIKEKLTKFEPNLDVQNSIFQNIVNLNYRVIDSLRKSENDQTDYFYEIMDIVFNSDTYWEFNEKIHLIHLASNRIGYLFREDPRDLIDLLNKIKPEFTWPNINSINIIERSDSIMDRTIALYQIHGYIKPDSEIIRKYKNNDYKHTSDIARDFKNLVSEKSKEEPTITAKKKRLFFNKDFKNN